VVVDYAIALVDELQLQPKQPFLATKVKAEDTPKFKVTMGIMPDYAFDGKGVHVDGVTDGKPAALAGLKKGDIIIKLGDIDVTDMTTYMKALAAQKKGSVAEVVVMRGTERVVSKVEFK
jgi:S1-C subfamily serine protease